MQENIQTDKTILIVEDSDDDYEITAFALTSSYLANPIYRCETGQEALDYLFHRERYSKNPPPKPGIILLDLNMPGLSGEQVLQQIKREEHLTDIPIIILTTSAADNTITKCYKHGANTFITKPVDLDSFMAAMQQLKNYWFEIAVLPKPN